MEFLVLTYSNYRNSFLDEWEESVKRNNYNYKILGNGEKWEGFATKTKAIAKELEKLDSNLLVIVCDAFDILFLQGPDELSYWL